jgi:hypothetical protein
MADYGVQPTGYVRKPLAVFLSELQQSAIDEFGIDIIQTAESPLGQIQAIMALAFSEVDETIFDTYQSFDADVSEGPRQDIIGGLRDLVRQDDEADSDYRLRITNQGQGNIKLTAIVDALRAIPGVTWAAAIENRTAAVNALGMDPHSAAYAVKGGADEDVALAIYQMSVPGIGLEGNTLIEVVADGYCQSVRFVRPVDVPIQINLVVRAVPDACNCAPPSIGTIIDFVVADFENDRCGFRHGDSVTVDRVEVAAAKMGTIIVQEVAIARVADLVEPEDGILEMGLNERAVIRAANIIVEYVSA